MSVIEQILLDIVVSVFPETLSLFEIPQKRSNLNEKWAPEWTVRSGTENEEVKFWVQRTSFSGISLDVPPKKELGDFAFNVFPYAKATRLAPPVIAEKIADELKKHSDHFQNVSIMGGYVNFFLTTQAWMDIFNGLSTTNKPKNNETVVVDYIGANAGKPLHIGHLCTPSVGQTIINTYKYLGYNVIGDSHFGDWGGIFGKIIYVWKNPQYIFRLEKYNDLHDKFLDKDVLGRKRFIEQQFSGKWVEFLLDLYQAFHTSAPSSEDWEEVDADEWARIEFKKLSEWDTENVELWKKFTSISIAEVNKKLELINVHPKYNIGESFYEGLDLPRPNNEDYPDLKENMKDVVSELVKKGVATQNEDGSVGVGFPGETKIPSCVLQKKDGTGLYLTSDLAAIKYRITAEWKEDWKILPKISKIIYCVDSRQQLHLKQAFTIAKMAWPELLGNTELFHAFNGFIKLKEGAMSTRKGTVIFLSDLINEGFNRTKAILEAKGQNFENIPSEEKKENINAITIGAIKYSYLAQDREKDVVFDWDKALSFEGNSGPYIQYSYVRAKQIHQRALTDLSHGFSLGHVVWGNRLEFDDSKLSLSGYDTSCLRQLSFFGKAVSDSALKYKPHIIASYCYDLASEFNAFYVHTPKILEEQDENLRNFRLALIGKVAETLKKGFELLAIEMPSKM